MKFIVVILLAFSSSYAFSIEWNVKDNIHVTDIRAQGQRDIISFTTAEPIYNPGSCGGGTADHYVIPIAEEVSDHMLSILLSAAAMGKTVGVNVHSGECFAGRPVVLDVWINY